MTTLSTAELLPGQEAPDFTLPSTSGEPVTLSSFRGTRYVLLAFFPAAFTSVCSSEMCAFSEDYDAFSGSNVEVLPISVDNTPSLQEFRRKYEMRVTLLSDMRRTVSAAYGTLWKDGLISNRAYFLIDPKGIVRWRHIEEHPGLSRSNAEILSAIQNVISED